MYQSWLSVALFLLLAANLSQTWAKKGKTNSPCGFEQNAMSGQLGFQSKKDLDQTKCLYPINAPQNGSHSEYLLLFFKDVVLGPSDTFYVKNEANDKVSGTYTGTQEPFMVVFKSSKLSIVANFDLSWKSSRDFLVGFTMREKLTLDISLDDNYGQLTTPVHTETKGNVRVSLGFKSGNKGNKQSLLFDDRPLGATFIKARKGNQELGDYEFHDIVIDDKLALDLDLDMTRNNQTTTIYYKPVTSECSRNILVNSSSAVIDLPENVLSFEPIHCLLILRSTVGPIEVSLDGLSFHHSTDHIVISDGPNLLSDSVTFITRATGSSLKYKGKSKFAVLAINAQQKMPKLKLEVSAATGADADSPRIQKSVDVITPKSSELGFSSLSALETEANSRDDLNSNTTQIPGVLGYSGSTCSIPYYSYLYILGNVVTLLIGALVGVFVTRLRYIKRRLRYDPSTHSVSQLVPSKEYP